MRNNLLYKTLSLALITMLLPIIGIAGEDITPSQADKLREHAKHINKCTENIDDSVIATFKSDGRMLETKVQALCEAGEKDKAQQSAIEFAQKVSSSEEVQTMKKCSVITLMLVMDIPMSSTKEISSPNHVCDDI